MSGVYFLKFLKVIFLLATNQKVVGSIPAGVIGNFH